MDDTARAYAHLAAKDRVLARLIADIGPASFAPSGFGFADLAEAIVCQQLSAKAGASIWKTFRALFPIDGLTPHMVAGKTEEYLRRAGISRAKASYIRNVAHAFLDGTVTPDGWPVMDDEAIITQLIRIKGVGRWTAEMFLMFSLGRPDVFSYGDLGLRKAMMVSYGLKTLPDPACMAHIADTWRPYRTYAALLLWKSLSSV